MSSPRFAIVGSFIPFEEVLPLARAADELGYAGFSVADHVVDIETLSTPYPYSKDGSRRWQPGQADWPDPWVAIAALAAVTESIEFFTSIYVPSLRDPFQVARAVGTAAVISNGRVKLGAGVGWSRDEFELMGQDFGNRGRRTDEALDLIRRLWTEEWVESDGPLYPAPRLTMKPLPAHPIPILIGGMSEVALRRAARFDGWIGDMCSTAAAGEYARRLRELRPEDAPAPEVIVALNDAIVPEQFAAAADLGVTEVMTQPWYYYTGEHSSLEQKIESLHRFKADVLDHLSE